MKKISLPKDWVCDDSTLKPKIGVTLSNTWIYERGELKPKMNASQSNSYDTNGNSILIVWAEVVLKLW